MEIQYNRTQNYEFERDLPLRGSLRRLEKEIKSFEKKNGLTLTKDEKEQLIPILERTLELNYNPEVSQGVGEVASTYEFCDIAKLRTEVFSKAGFIQYFNPTSSGMLYDPNDARSIILRYRRGDKITGSIGIVLDIKGKPLKSEEDGISYNKLRREGRIAELNRLVVSPDYQGKKMEFRELYKGVFETAMKENIEHIILVFRTEQEEMYHKFGGMKCLHRFENYKGITDMSNSMFAWKVKESLSSEYFVNTIINNPVTERLQ